MRTPANRECWRPCPRASQGLNGNWIRQVTDGHEPTPSGSQWSERACRFYLPSTVTGPISWAGSSPSSRMARLERGRSRVRTHRWISIGEYFAWWNMAQTCSGDYDCATSSQTHYRDSHTRGGDNIDCLFLDEMPSNRGLATTHKPSSGRVSLREFRLDEVDAPAAESGTIAAAWSMSPTTLNRDSSTKVAMRVGQPRGMN